MAAYLKANDVISGQEVEATMTVYESGGGEKVVNMFWAKNLDAKIDMDVQEIYTLGKRGAQHKPNGWKGSGSMTIFHVTSQFRAMMLTYIKSGQPVYFDMLVRHCDPSSGAGVQEVTLKHCCLQSINAAKFDTENQTLDENVDFVFDDYDVLQEYVEPELGENQYV